MTTINPHDLVMYNDYRLLKEVNLYKKRETDAGWDIRLPQDISLYPGQLLKIHTGLHVHIPLGFFGLIKVRSSLFFKHDIDCINAGVIDYGYTGEIVIGLISLAKTLKRFKAPQRVAQLILIPNPHIDLTKIIRRSYSNKVPEVDIKLWPESDRGEAGLGITDKRS